MSIGIAALIILALGPAIFAIVLGVRIRRDEQRRLELALEEERLETRLRHQIEDQMRSSRQSFSGYPFDRRHR